MRGEYVSTKELMDAIEAHVKSGGEATLALDYRWWAKRICSPYEARIVGDAQLFDTEFPYSEILKELKARGLNFVKPLGQSSLGYVEMAS